MPRQDNIGCHIWLTFAVNHFAATMRFHPALGREVLSILVASLHVHVFHGWADIGKPPCNTLIVPDDDVRHTGQGHACCIESAAVQMSFVPKIRHLMSEMHVIR